MTPERDPIDDLLASIADGTAVDWEAASRRAAPGSRTRVAALREVSHIAAFSRSLQRATEPAAPERWGDLLLLERLGSGTHADVYRAWDARLQREVALKLIRPGSDADASWLDEGRAAARVRHPNVVSVHGVDRRDGRAGLWMELVRGVTLERRVTERGPLAPAEAARLGAEIGSALAAVHAAGTVHRDVKPANVVRDDEDRHVLTDFGLGVRQGDLARVGPSGTPMYMAPELLAGAPASPRSDVYALGMTLWFALTGRHPFEAGSLPELIDAARRGPRPLRSLRADVPVALAAAIERAIAPAPEARFADARELVAAVTRATSARPRVAHPHRVAAAGGLQLALAGPFVLWRSPSRVDQVAPPAVAPSAAATWTIDASLVRRDVGGATRLVTGDRVKPGDRLSLEFHASKAAWVYVLNEDEQGERYLLFPQPRFDLQNPLPAGSDVVLPGPVGGRENAWTVTSAGGREYFLVVASPEPVAELEADLGRLPAPRPDRPVDYARVGEASVERLRGVGGVTALPPQTPAAPRSRAFERFRALAGRETGVTGTWVRQVVLENPR